jgi:hypothetical protein
LISATEPDRSFWPAACAQLDGAEELAAEISADGPVIRTQSGTVKAHPAIGPRA